MTHGAEVRYCAEEVRPGDLESPPEFCEEEALEGSDFCYSHDPDGAAADHADALAEARMERGLSWV